MKNVLNNWYVCHRRAKNVFWVADRINILFYLAQIYSNSNTSQEWPLWISILTRLVSIFRLIESSYILFSVFLFRYIGLMPFEFAFYLMRIFSNSYFHSAIINSMFVAIMYDFKTCFLFSKISIEFDRNCIYFCQKVRESKL